MYRSFQELFQVQGWRKSQLRHPARLELKEKKDRPQKNRPREWLLNSPLPGVRVRSPSLEFSTLVGCWRNRNKKRVGGSSASIGVFPLVVFSPSNDPYFIGGGRKGYVRCTLASPALGKAIHALRTLASTLWRTFTSYAKPSSIKNHSSLPQAPWPSDRLDRLGLGPF